MFELFFTNAAVEFATFGQKEAPSAINKWLSSLCISERNHCLHILVKEKKDDFELEVQVSNERDATPLKLSSALKLKDPALRLMILSDLSILCEHMPKLEEAIDAGTNVSFSLDEFAPLFINILPALKVIGINIILPKALQKILRPHLNLALKSKEKLDQDRQTFLSLDQLLDFNWEVAIGDKKISVTEFTKLLKQSRGLVKMIDGYVMLDEKEMQILLKQLEKLPTHISKEDLLQAALAGEIDGATIELDKHLTNLIEGMKKFKNVKTPSNLHAELRPYQKIGFNWLIQNMKYGFGSILADDMGLGKTLQVITAILHMKNEGVFDLGCRALIVAPTSLLSNWRKEISRFAPSLNADIYHGIKRDLTQDSDIVITSYGLARTDGKVLNKYKWHLLVIDEAQNIKNHNSEQAKAIKSITAQHKIAMSGTPVENRLSEYWSIFDFANKHYLGTPAVFKKRYASPIENERDQECLLRFKKVTSPFILRRSKSDKTIISDLPEKLENNKYCALTSEQTAIYQEIVNASIKKIEKSEGIERKGLVLKLINALKQTCNHPSQFGKKKGAKIEQSGKMEVLQEILLEIGNVGEKAIIFTQYTEMGEIIAKLIGDTLKMKIPFLHDGLSRKIRDEMVDEFQNHSNVKILIISLKAGGTGLNLTAANHVIHYDLWWNPAVEAQATDRAYRIGQKRNVMVHRLITTGTFEEHIDEMIKSKKELADLTVDSGENWITEMNNEQIMELINLTQSQPASAGCD